MKNQTLTILAGVFIILVALVTFQRSEDDKNFKEVTKPLVASIETTDKILITRNDTKEIITLEKKDQQWSITTPIQEKASESRIKEVLDQTSKISIGKIISESKEKFQEMHLTDTNGTKVQFFNNGTQVAGFQVGKITEDDYNHTFVKLLTEDKVYLAQGAFEGVYNTPAKSFRDKKIFTNALGDISEVSMKREKNKGTFLMTEGKWTKKEDSKVTSENIVKELSALLALEASDFPDKSGINPQGLKDTQSVKIYMKASKEGSDGITFYAKEMNKKWYGIKEKSNVVYELPASFDTSLKALGL